MSLGLLQRLPELSTASSVTASLDLTFCILGLHRIYFIPDSTGTRQLNNCYPESRSETLFIPSLICLLTEQTDFDSLLCAK